MLYCTRKNIHVDRCASAWLIRRFLDPEAKFIFVDGQIPAPEAIPFDMHGVEWGHHGNRCTFETIVALHELDHEDAAMSEVARIIHGADITTDADETLESAGVDLLFRGLRMVSPNDEETLERGLLLMDALYAGVQAELPVKVDRVLQ